MCNLLIPDFISHVAIIIIFCCGILVCYKYSSLGSPKKKQSLPLDLQLKVLKRAKSRMEEAPQTLTDKENRIKFLNWCINQIELQIKYETQKNKGFYSKRLK